MTHSRPQLAAALLAVGCALTALVAVPARGATTTKAAVSAGILQLAEQTPTVDPNGTFTAQISAVGAPPGAKVRVTLHARVATRSQYALTINGSGLGSTLSTPVRNVPIEDLPHATSDTFIVSIPIRESTGDTTRVRLSAAGVYPVDVDLFDSRGVPIDELTTPLVRLPDTGHNPPLSVALIVPVHGHPALKSNGTTQLAESDRAGMVKTIAELERAQSVPLSILATPETLDALAAGTETGDDDLLASLIDTSADRQVMTAPYVDLHIGEWTSPALKPLLGAEIGRGYDVLSERLRQPPLGTWVADGTVDDDALAVLRIAGMSRVVVPQEALAPLDNREFPRTLSRLFQIGPADGRVKAAMADTVLSSYAGASTDPVLDAEHLVGDLATLYFDEPSSQRGVVVEIPDTWTPNAGFLRALLSGLAPGPLFQPVTLDRFFSAVPMAGARGGVASSADSTLVRELTPEASSSLDDVTGAIASATASLGTYKGAIGPSSPRADPLERRLLVGGAADLDSSERLPYFQGVSAAVAREFAKVSALPGQAITLTSRTGRLPITVRNSAGYPLDVLVRLQSDRLEFPGLTNSTETLTLSSETTRVEVDVRARASGDSPLDVDILTPDGRIQLDHATYRVRSTAVSGVGLLLSVGAGGFLIVWWARTIRRDRRRRRGLAPKGRHARQEPPDPIAEPSH